MKKKEAKIIRKLVRQHLEENKGVNIEFVTMKLAAVPKPWYIPRLLWANIIKKIVLDFTSDQVNIKQNHA